MPNPNKGERRDDFVKRCVPEVLKDGTTKDPKQAVAICHSMFSEHQKKNKMSTYDKMCQKLNIKAYNGCKK